MLERYYSIGRINKYYYCKLKKSRGQNKFRQGVWIMLSFNNSDIISQDPTNYNKRGGDGTPRRLSDIRPDDVFVNKRPFDSS